MALLVKKRAEEVAKPELMTACSEPLTRTVSRNSTTQRDVTTGPHLLMDRDRVAMPHLSQRSDRGGRTHAWERTDRGS